MLVRHSGSDAASASARATGKKSLPVMSASRGNGPGAAPGIPGSEPATNGDVRRIVLRPSNPGLWLRGPHADSRQAPDLLQGKPQASRSGQFFASTPGRLQGSSSSHARLRIPAPPAESWAGTD